MIDRKMKSAAVLFVKNEFSDIIGWLFWYINLGFDKIVVYDDHSDDGTFEILNSLKCHYNIEVHRTNLDQYGTFYWRQRDAYMTTAYRLREEYDWVIFLDGDEYLFLENYTKVNDFLENFADADAIAINWCIFGNSHRALRNKDITPFSYFWRADETLGDACLVKSFVRPKKLSGNYFNPHKHEIISDNYFDAEGEKVEWFPGATKKINWENARIMHYICRSMEHYSDRIKKRFGQDSSDQLQNWNRFNRNDVYDESALKYFDDSIIRMKFYVFDALIDSIRNKYKGIVSEYCSYKRSEEKEYFLYSVYNKNGDKIYADEKFFLDTEGNKYETYFCTDGEKKGMFFCIDENKNISPVKILYSDLGLLSNFFQYEEVNGVFNLKNVFTNKYLSSSLQKKSMLELNRDIPSEWEDFTMREEKNFSVEKIQYFDFSGNTYNEFIKWVCINDEKISKIDFVFNFSSLKKEERNKCFVDFPNLWFNII